MGIDFFNSNTRTARADLEEDRFEIKPLLHAEADAWSCSEQCYF